MAATSTPDRLGTSNGAATLEGRHETPSRRLSTETKAAFKTTEFFAYLAVLASVLIAGAVVDGAENGGFDADRVWLYATLLTIGYMISRGIAKAGSRQPYDENNG